MSPRNPLPEPPADARGIAYTYRPRPMGAETVLTLRPQHLHAERAAKSFTISYTQIAVVQLSFRPRGAYLIGFRTKIYAADGRTITLDDSTWVSFFAQRRQGAAYRAFVLGLIARVRSANPAVRVVGGRNIWMQAATVAFGAVFAIALPIVAVRALAQGATGLGLAFAAFAAAFIGWTAIYIRRNRLRDLGTGVPVDLLPPEG